MNLDFLTIYYRNPAFSVAMLLLTIALIAIFDHILNLSKKKRQKRRIERFLSRFDGARGGKDYRELLATQPDSVDSLIVLASIYFKNGEYAESIHVYLAVLEIVIDKSLRVETMVLLGKAYHKAGFYHRSRDILLESLKLKARNREALKLLLIIYEQTKEYNRALEVLDALEELGRDSSKERSLLKANAIARDPILPIDKREEALLNLLKEAPCLFRLVLEFLLAHNPKKAWRIIDEERLSETIDLFWRSPKEIFEANEALKYPLLAELYSAKGWLEAAKQSAIFEFDLLIKLGGAKTIANLEFEYRCAHCLTSFPVHFFRCPNCQSVEAAQIEPILIKNVRLDDKNAYENSANFY
ncbi:MAG: hypothetical protein LBP89_09830 [Helicobacteraceae bacterium]|jgi:tetratricopeptide (TPR) repeat protein|nr:hypothetical protein [Helicobacteraceae bacterium]